MLSIRSALRSLLLALTALASTNAQPSLPAGFSDTLVASVGSPTALVFLPDGRMLITTQSGTVRIFDGTTLLSAPALSLGNRVCSNSERGLLGIAVDPGFAANRHIYLFYTFRNNGSCGTGSIGNPWNRVSRFTFSDSNTIPLDSEQVLIDGIWSYGGNHNAGDLEVGSDGMLYVSTGDGGNDYGGSGSGGANDAARERHHLLGKILRINLDGSVPSGNPFTGANTGRCNTGALPPGQICQEIFAWGLRNPFRFAFDPNSSGTRFFINDVGQGAWEEINQGQSGADYGWNTREGFCANGSTTSCPPSSPTPVGMTEPVFAYRHGPSLPGTQTGACRSITGGAFVPNGAWPPEYDGAYLFSDFVCGSIFALRQNGASATVTDFVRDLGNSSAVHLRFGPLGSGQALYYTTYAGGGQVRRVAPAAATNLPPTATISAVPTSGPTPLQVSFSAAGSGDPNPGDTLSYIWNFGDSSPEQTTTGVTVAHTYLLSGIYTATVRARDNQGAFSQPATAMITAGNQAPQLTMTAPAAGFTYAVGTTVTLTASAIDPEQGALPPSAISWRVVLHHDQHTHPFLGPLTGNNLTFQAPAPEDLAAASNSYLEVIVRATDGSGAFTEVTRDIQPRKVSLSFQTEPAGLNLLVNNETFSGGVTVTSWENFVLSVSPPAQSRNGITYDFDAWLDGAPRNRAITTPAAPASYTARFRDVSTGGGFTTVAAGSFLAGPLARGSIVSGFGQQLAAIAQPAAAVPLPTQIQDISMRLIDSSGASRPLPLFFVSPTQLNFLIPEAALSGNARIEVLRDGTVIAQQAVEVSDAGPSIFTANQEGTGVPAAEVVRVAANGVQATTPAFVCSGTPQICSPAEINLGNAADSTFLVLYATGLRNRPAGSAVRVFIQGVEAEVSFAGAQPQFVGLDQVNVKIPPALRGRGLVTVTLAVGQLAANPVEIRIQ
ncbi:MAG: PQQ-dependent sugar dehydrogenase [Bryobacterales bacterium]|nr:PQQ-dependent sugar dehydrogenase [Bryobacterales bacterium]